MGKAAVFLFAEGKKKDQIHQPLSRYATAPWGARGRNSPNPFRRFDRLSDRRIIDRYYNRSLWFVRSLSLWFDRSLSLSKCTNHRSDKATETENAAHNRGIQITHNECVRLLPGTKFQTRRSCLWLIDSVLSATETANSKCPADAMIRGKYIVP